MKLTCVNIFFNLTVPKDSTLPNYHHSHTKQYNSVLKTLKRLELLDLIIQTPYALHVAFPRRGQNWPWPLILWPKINRIPPLIIHNLHVKFESDWAKTVVCILPTRSYTQSAKANLDLEKAWIWPIYKGRSLLCRTYNLKYECNKNFWIKLWMDIHTILILDAHGHDGFFIFYWGFKKQKTSQIPLTSTGIGAVTLLTGAVEGGSPGGRSVGDWTLFIRVRATNDPAGKKNITIVTMVIFDCLQKLKFSDKVFVTIYHVYITHLTHGTKKTFTMWI